MKNLLSSHRLKSSQPAKRIYLLFALLLSNGTKSHRLSMKNFDEQLLASFGDFASTNKANQCSCLITHDLSLPIVVPLLYLQIWNSVISPICNSAGLYVTNVNNLSLQANSDSDLAYISSFKNRVDIGKNRPSCSIGIIFLFHTSSLNILPEFFNYFRQMYGIIKTFQDQFLLFSQNLSTVDSMLKSDSFGTRFKNVLGFSIETNHVRIRKLCYECSNKSVIKEASSVPFSLNSDHTLNLHAKVLKVSTPLSTRWLNEMHTVGNHWIPKRGIYSIVLSQLMETYNFTAEFIPSTGGGTGARVNKTTWVGTVGDVMNRKADIGHVTALTLQRFIVVDATFAVSYEWLTFTTGKAPEYHTWKTVYWPFTPLVWQLTGVTTLLVIILFKVVMKVTRQSASVAKIVEYMLAVVMEEGVKDPEQYPTHSLRFTMVLWLIFGLLSATAYRSKLTAFLTFPAVEILPQNFEELSGSKFSIGLQYIKGAAYQILKHSKNPTYASIFKRMELEESDVKCFKRTITTKFACISWDSMADYVYHKNLTDKSGHVPVVKSPASACFLTAGMVMEKRSILKASFDHLLIWAMDTGTMSKWRQMDNDFVARQRKHWEKETNQPDVSYLSAKTGALTLSHVSGGYVFFLVGIFLSVISFSFETIINQVRNCMGRITLIDNSCNI